MGLIKAGLGALGGTLADQWKEFFYCDAMDKDVLVTRGKKQVSGRSSNTKGHDNVISSGSGIAVADGQCMIIVEQGKVVEVCAEPGQFTYDASTEPSIFAGNLGESILATFKTIGKRFTYGGDTGKDQRVYYFNTKEILDNKFGTPNPIPFRVVDSKIGLDVDVSVRCSGLYSYVIADPLLFYTNVCGNVEEAYVRENIEGQLRTELLSALSPAFGKISQQGIIYSDLTMHTMAIGDELNEILSKKWRDLRGIEIVSFGVSSIRPDEESEKKIREMQETLFYSDPTLAGARTAAAAASAMETAAGNSAGAMTGFMGLGMAGNIGGGNAANLFAMGQQQPVPVAPAAPAAPAAGSWTCSCGTVATGKFCPECGSPKPVAEGWTCSCGAVNKGKFCPECGAKKPAGVPQYKCDKCGWEPEKGAQPPKFCPECGDPFDAGDIQ